MSITVMGPKELSIIPVSPPEEAPVKTKKDEAFKLFDEGKVPGDPEVMALGLKSESETRYYRLWKNE